MFGPLTPELKKNVSLGEAQIPKSKKYFFVNNTAIDFGQVSNFSFDIFHTSLIKRSSFAIKLDNVPILTDLPEN